MAITIKPSQIRIKGLSDDIDEIDSVKVATIDETEIMSDGMIVYGIDLPGGISLADDAENVVVDITHKNTSVKTLAVNNIRLENKEEGKKYEILTDTVNVTLRGSIGEYFTYFDAENVTVVLDLKNYHGITGTVTVPAQIEIINSSDNAVIYPLGSYSVNLAITK